MNWLLHQWWRRKLKKQKPSPFKMKSESEAISSSCVLRIQHTTEPLFLSLKNSVFELGIKKIQNNRSRHVKSDSGKTEVKPNPLFTQDEISTIVRRFWFGIVVITIFLLSEGALYRLTAALFVPGGSEVLKMGVAIFLALLSFVCIDYGLKHHYKYRELKSGIGRHEGTVLDLKLENDKRILGYVLIVIAVSAILFAGISRIYFLENVDTNGLPPERKHSVVEASKWASWLTLVVTIASSIFLGIFKRDQSKIIEQYQVYKYWNNALKKRNALFKKLLRDSNMIYLKTHQIIEAGTQLIIDLKRLFKMEQEYDPKYEALNQEYLDAKHRPGFSMNEHIFRKYSPIQSAHLELFRYGVLTSEVKEKLFYASEVQKIAEDYLRDHGTAIYRQEEVLQVPKPTLNGNHTKEKSIVNT